MEARTPLARSILAALLLASLGCAGTVGTVVAQRAPPDLRFTSAAIIGCAADETEIADLSWPADEESPTAWIATCQGKTFYCSSVPTADGPRGAASCSPEQMP